MGIAVRAAAVAVAASAALTVGGCGSDSSTVARDPTTVTSTGSSPTATSDPPHAGPACEAVWHGGARLAQRYRGCLDTVGWVKAQTYQCSDGHRLVTYAHAFYARPGRTITKSSTTLVHDHAFRHLMALCGA